MGGQDRVVIITQGDMALRWTQKESSFILQKSWSDIKSQTFILGQIPDLNLSQILGMKKTSANNKQSISNIICNKKHWKTGFFVGIGEEKSSILDFDGGYTGKIYPLWG